VSQIAAAVRELKPKTLWTGLVAVVGLISLILGIVVAIIKLIPTPATPHQSIVFILDVSPAMYARVQHRTRARGRRTNETRGR
jgi:hypothetical protein